jgi:hypothetical protein
MAHYVDFDWALPPRKRRIEVEAPPKPNPPREVENSGNEWTVVTQTCKELFFTRRNFPFSYVEGWDLLHIVE